MRRTVLAVTLAAATLVALVTTPAHGQSTQTARGTVTAMAGNAGHHRLRRSRDELRDRSADRGHGDRRRHGNARRGGSGEVRAEVLRADQGRRRDRSRLSRSRWQADGGERPPRCARRWKRAPVRASRRMSINGTVESVTPVALMITGGSGGGSTFRQTFTIDEETKVVGRGAGTASRAGKVTAPDLVSAGDRVSVSYHRSRRIAPRVRDPRRKKLQ